MPSENEHDIVDELSQLLLDIMMLGNPPHVPACFASIDSLQILYANLISLRDFLYAASNGDLSRQVSFKGYIGGALKTLQANLRHITWQTKMVASGDFTQRVEFIGEFSQSFNAMVIQLDQTLNELVRKDTELSKVNEDLLKEIDSRKQTEVALRKSEEEMRLLAITDSLTGLYNRMHFFERAENEFSRSLRYSRPLSVMMFDIDFFKRINDTFGHTSGDMVLKMVAATTKETVRTTVQLIQGGRVRHPASRNLCSRSCHCRRKTEKKNRRHHRSGRKMQDNDNSQLWSQRLSWKNEFKTTHEITDGFCQ